MTKHNHRPLVFLSTLSFLFLISGRIGINVHGFHPTFSPSRKQRNVSCHRYQDERQGQQVGSAAFLHRGVSSFRSTDMRKRDSRNDWNLIKSSISSINIAMIPLRSSAFDSISDLNETAGNSDHMNAKKSKRILLIWVHLLSIFIATNYFRSSLFPLFLLSIPPKIWSLIHSLGAMAFSGGIITTTLLEWNLPRLIAKFGHENSNTPNKNNLVTELLRWLFRIESSLVLPGVTLTLFSGVVQSHQTYGTFRHAPRHVKSALHLMLVFAVWWVIMDRRSQKSLLGNEYYGDSDDDLFASSASGVVSGVYYDKDKIVGRRLANVVSCLFLVVLYGVMIMKPGLA